MLALPVVLLLAMPADVRTSLDRGMAAAKSDDLRLALRYLDGAWKSDPLEPEVLLDLATVHAQAGHGLAAVAWYQAYLASVPKGTAGTKKIASSVDGLKTEATLAMGALFEEAQSAADAIPGDDPDSKQLRRGANDDVVGAEIRGGQAEGVLASLDPEKSTLYDSPAAVWTEAARAAADEGDFAGALALAGKLVDPARKDEVAGRIWTRAIAAGDLDSARAAAKLLSDAEKKKSLLGELSLANARARLEEDDFTPAEEWLSHDADPAQRQAILLRIVDRKALAADFAGAEKAAKDLDDQNALLARGVLALDRLRASDKAGAKKEIEPVLATWAAKEHVDTRLLSLSQAISGDAASALATIEWLDYTHKKLVPDEEREAAYADVAEVQAWTGDLAGAWATADQVVTHLPEEMKPRGEVAARIARVLEAKGKGDEAAAAVKKIADPALRASTLEALAKRDLVKSTASAAEQWVMQMPEDTPDLLRAKTAALLEVAAGFTAKKAAAGAHRTLAAARLAAIGCGDLAAYGRIAELQSKLGEPDAAKATRAELILVQWTALARDLGADRAVVDRDALLAEAKAASPDSPWKAPALVGQALGHDLSRIDRLAPPRKR